MQQSIAQRLTAIWHAPRNHLGVRIALCMITLCLSMAGISATSLWQMRKMNLSFTEVISERVPAIAAAQQLVAEVSRINLAARDVLIAGSPEQAQSALAQIESGRATVGQQIESLQKMLHNSGEREAQLAESLGNQSSGILVVLIKFSRYYSAGKTEQARALLLDGLQAQMAAITATLEETQQLQVEQLKATEQNSTRMLRSALTAAIGALTAALVIAVFLARALTLSITRPVSSMAEVAEHIANGDLNLELQTTCSDELGRLQHAMARMRSHLINLVGDIRQAAEQLSSTSEEFADANSDLSNRTASTAGALQESSASIKKLTDTVQQTAGSAHSAAKLASSASEAAQRGGVAVTRVVNNMQGITTSSRKINDIIGVIDGIAFQTNLLALNAAVEAARAGDQGRGFAVVAGEVRNLAQRSAQAAMEIKKLISSSVDQVALGSAMVEETGATMDEIVTSVARVNTMIDEITRATDLQSQGLRQTTAAVNEVDAMTQQNAAMVQQTAAAAQSLREQAGLLEKMVDVFQIPNSAHHQAGRHPHLVSERDSGPLGVTSDNEKIQAA